MCAADNGGVNFIKDVLANYTDFRLGRDDKAACRVVVGQKHQTLYACRLGYTRKY